MRIYSWNMLFENRRLDDALELIQLLEFDILCLQEVPENFLKRLKGLPFHLASAIEQSVLEDGRHSDNHVVILSHLPFARAQSFALPFHDPGFPLRARLFIRTLQWLGVWSRARGAGNRHGLFVDIRTAEGSLVRVFSVHLTLAAPTFRRIELELLTRERDAAMPSIVCGDFNITDSYLASPIGWFFGGTMLDALFPWRERVSAEMFYADLGFTNPLRGMVTHPSTRTQLDHILVPEHMPVLARGVHTTRAGSDHRPVWVEVTV